MDDNTTKSTEGRRLWTKARIGLRSNDELAARGPGDEAPDPLLLAAYLDGGLSGDALESLETRLSGDAGTLDLLLAARTDRAGPPAAVARRVTERAKAIKASEARTAAGSLFAGLWERLSGRWRAAALGGATALYLVACAATFDLGRQGALNTLMASGEGPGFSYALSLNDVL